MDDGKINLQQMVSSSRSITSGSITEIVSEHTPPVVVQAIRAIRSSFLLFVGVVGVVSLLVGIYMNDGILAGMFGVWGISAIASAAIAYALLSVLQ